MPSKYKVIMKYPNGETHEEDPVFDNEEDAEAYGLDQCGNFIQGGEDLHNSNPGDHPFSEDDEDVDFEVIEVA